MPHKFHCIHNIDRWKIGAWVTNKPVFFLLHFTSNKHWDKGGCFLYSTEKTGSGRPGHYNVQLTAVNNKCYQSSVCVRCVWVHKGGERAEVMNESGCGCANVYSKVPSMSIIGGCFIPTIFRPISKPTAGQWEGCYPQESIDPRGNASAVQSHVKSFSIYTCSCVLMYCNWLYDVYF